VANYMVMWALDRFKRYAGRQTDLSVMGVRVTDLSVMGVRVGL